MLSKKGGGTKKRGGHKKGGAQKRGGGTKKKGGARKKGGGGTRKKLDSKSWSLTKKSTCNILNMKAKNCKSFFFLHFNE